MMANAMSANKRLSVIRSRSNKKFQAQNEEALKSEMRSIITIAQKPKSSRTVSDTRTLRKHNKNLRLIAEEQGSYYPDEDVEGEELASVLESFYNLKLNNIKSVLDEINLAQSVDLCFLIDTTVSMYPYIQGITGSIVNIVSRLTKPMGTTTQGVVSNIRIGLIGFRNRHSCDKLNQFEIFPFSHSTESFKLFCGNLKTGGDIGDVPVDVDVLGGIFEALQLKWSHEAGTRLLFHIGGAPCHDFDFDDDSNYPNEKSCQTLFSKLRTKNIRYYFGRVNNSTDKMTKRFSEAYKNDIQIFDIADDVNQIQDSIVMAVVKSYEHSIESSKASKNFGKTLRNYKIVNIEPDWGIIQAIEGTYLTYVQPADIASIFTKPELVRKAKKHQKLQIADNPFAEGSDMLIYYGINAAQPRTTEGKGRRPVKIVCKEYKYVGEEGNSYVKYDVANEVQSIASFLASKFEDERQKLGLNTGLKIKFIKTKTLCAVDSRRCPFFMSVESLFKRKSSNFVKFNNLNNVLMESNVRSFGINAKYFDSLSAFSHWSYKVTKGKLIVVDFEGVISKHKSPAPTSVVLTYPVIHSIYLTRFGNTNMGQAGMDSFFMSHKCNSFCSGMGLSGKLEY